MSAGGVSVNVNVLGNLITNTTTATVLDSTVTADEDITVSAEELAPGVLPPWIFPVAGTLNWQQTIADNLADSPVLLDTNIISVNITLSGGGAVAVGVNLTGNLITNTTDAVIVNSIVRAGVLANGTVTNPAADISVSAVSTSGITSLSAGLAAAAGVGVSATGFGNVITNTIEATIEGGSTVTVGGLVDLSASDNSTIRSIGLSAAGAGGVAAGVLVGANVVTNTVSAMVCGSTVIAGSNDYVVSPTETVSDVGLWLSAASDASILGFTGGVAGAGGGAAVLSLSANVIANRTEAGINDRVYDEDGDLIEDAAVASHVEADGAIAVTAGDSSTIDALAFGVSAAVGGAIGAALAANVIANTIESGIAGSVVNTDSSLAMTSESSAVIRALAIGVSGSGGFAVQVTALGNVITNSVTATISGDSLVTAAGDVTLYASDIAPSLIPFMDAVGDRIPDQHGDPNDPDYDANAKSPKENLVDSLDGSPIDLTGNILALVVNVAGSGGVAAGVTVLGNKIANVVEAGIVNSTVKVGVEPSDTYDPADGITASDYLVNEDSDLSLTARSHARIIAVSAGFAASGIAAADAIVFGNSIDNIVTATASDQSVVHVGGAVDLSAVDESDITALGLSFAGSGTLAGSVVVAKNDIGDDDGTNVSSAISGSTVLTGGNVTASAVENASILSFVGGVAVSGVGSATLSLTLNHIDNAVEVSIGNSVGAGATVDAGVFNAGARGAISLTATDTSTIDSIAIGLSASALGAAGAAVAKNTVDNDVSAGIIDSIVSSDWTITLDAVSVAVIRSLAAGLAGAGLAAGQASVTLNEIRNTTSATISGSTVTATGAITVSTVDARPDELDDYLEVMAVPADVVTSLVNALSDATMDRKAGILSFAGSIGGAGLAAGSAAASDNDIKNTVQATLVNSVVTSVDASVSVTADSNAKIVSIAAGIGAAGGVALNASATTNTIHNDIRACVTGSSVLSAGGTITIDANDRAEVTSLAMSLSGAIVGALGAAVVTNAVTNNSRAYMEGSGPSVGKKATIAQATDVSIAAHSEVTIHGSTLGASVGVVAGGGSSTTTTVGGCTKAYVGDYVEVGKAQGKTVDELKIEATSNVTAESKARALSAGGGAAACTKAIAEVDRSAEATIGRSDIEVNGDVTVVARSLNKSYSYANGTALAGAAAGSVKASATMMSNQTLASVGAGATIIAGRDVTIYSKSYNKTKAQTAGGIGGLFAAGGQTATAKLIDNKTKSRVGNGVTITAGGTVEVSSENVADIRSETHQVSGGLVTINQVRSTTKITNSQTLAEVGDGSDISACDFVLSARDTSVYAGAVSYSKTAAADSESHATSEIDVDATSHAYVGSSSISAERNLTILSRQDDVKTDAQADTAIAFGLTGKLVSRAENQLDANSNITTQPGSELATSNLRVEAETPYIEDGYHTVANTDAQTVISYVWDVVGEACKWVWKILTFGLWDGKEVCEPVMGWVRVITHSDSNATVLPDPPHNLRRSTIDFNSSVTILGSSSSLVINADGSVETTGDITPDMVHETGSEIVVDDIVTGAAGKVVIGSTLAWLKGHATFTFSDAFSVSITNHRAKDIRLNGISAWQQVQGCSNLMINVCQRHWDVDQDGWYDFTYDILPDIAGETAVNIENTADSDVILNGLIENRRGTTRIANAGGSVYASGEGLVRTRVVELPGATGEGIGGNIGASGTPLAVELHQFKDRMTRISFDASGDLSENELDEYRQLTTEFAFHADGDLCTDIYGVLDEGSVEPDPFVSYGREITAGGVAVVNLMQGTRQSYETSIVYRRANIELYAKGDPIDILDLDPCETPGQAHYFTGGSSFDPGLGVHLVDPTGDAVDTVANTINLGDTHRFTTGQAVVYSSGTGTSIDGLVDGQTYYIVYVGADRVSLAQSKDDAVAEAPAVVNLGLSGVTGTDHSLRSKEDIDVVDLHGFSTGQAVVYINGGGASIGGLRNGDIYYVVRVNATTIRLARSSDEANSAAETTFDPSSDVAADDTIDLGYDHGFVTGDMVVYSHGDGGTSIGGLTDGRVYHVARVDSTTIRLEDRFDPESDVASDDSINLGYDHGLATGDAVVYRSGGGTPIGGLRDAETYYVTGEDPTCVRLARTVAEATEDPSTLFGPSDVNDMDDANTINLGYDHGFVTGDIVLYSNGGGTDIGGLKNAMPYFVIRVDSDTIQLAASEGGDAIDVSGTGSGTSHRLRLHLDASDATGHGHSLCRVLDPGAAAGTKHGFRLAYDLSTATGSDHGFNAVFDPTTAVDTDNDTVNLGYFHRFKTGDVVVYRNGGGSDIGDLTDESIYYVVVVDYRTIRLVGSLEEAHAMTNPVRVKFTKLDFGEPGPPRVEVDEQLVTITLNTSQGNETTAQELVDAINNDPDASELIGATLVSPGFDANDDPIPPDGDVDVTTDYFGGDPTLILSRADVPTVLSFEQAYLDFRCGSSEPQDGTYVIERGGQGSGSLTINGNSNEIQLAGVLDYASGSVSISTDASILSTGANQLIRAEDITLESSGGAVGDDSIAVKISHTEGELDVRADEAIYVSAPAGDIRIGEIVSGGPVVLTADGSIIDGARDVHNDMITGTNITLIASTGGIGASTNPLDIDSDTLTASAAGDIHINETLGDLNVMRVISSSGDVVLTADGSITDAAGDDLSNVTGTNVNLIASTGGIGQSSNPVDIDSAYAGPGVLVASADKGVYLVETSGALNVSQATSNAGDVWLAVADTEDAGEDLVITDGGTVSAADGSVSLLAGDDFSMAATSTIHAAGAVVIQGDHGDADADVGCVVDVRGPVSGSTVEVSGGSDSDLIRIDTVITASTTVLANGGNDTFVLGDGAGINGIADGGEGIDTLDYSAWTIPVVVDLTMGSATSISEGAAGCVVDFENIVGGFEEDLLTGDDKANVLEGGPDDDVAYGLGGDDVFIGGQGIDTFHGGEGSDTVDYSGAPSGVIVDLEIGRTPDDGLGGRDVLSGMENVIGSPFDDTIHGSRAPNRIWAGEGADTVSTPFGREPNELYGEGGDDYLLGGGGADLIRGGPGNDTINGGGGDDVIHGDEGDDDLRGGVGSDVLWGDDGNDHLDGGSDNDDLHGGPGADVLTGGLGNDTLFGDAGDDHLDGGLNDDRLHGGADADVLIGGFGNDELFGDAGNDYLDGGFGDDTLWGGPGDDVFDDRSGQNTVHREAQFVVANADVPGRAPRGQA